MSEELRKCPFCGKEVISYILEDFDNRKCVCQNDECVIGHYILDGKYWDVRPLEDALQAERDLLQKQLDVVKDAIIKIASPSYLGPHPMMIAQEALTEIAKFGEKK